jgi:hypothetical protein
MNQEQLHVTIRQAIDRLGTGFLRHPANTRLTDQLGADTRALEDFQRATVRWVYCLLFWFVLEDRGILPAPEASLAARRRYAERFSARRLREHTHGRQGELWDGVREVFAALGSHQGRPELALPGIGGIFRRICPPHCDCGGEWDHAALADEDLLSAVLPLAVNERQCPRDFGRLDPEELGNSYEFLLALQARPDPTARTFTLADAAGTERKISGSYYTPRTLVDALLDSALDPLLDEAERRAEMTDAKIAALLEITVCDPACGTGRFLVAAARRIADRIARLRSGALAPPTELTRAALRAVVTHVYGVDVNEMAAELAKITLWLESAEPGTPPAHLDDNIRVGNALLGATPTLLGIPDGETEHARLVADAWCAAYLPGDGFSVTDTRSIAADPAQATASDIQAITALARDHQLFHWYLEFPHIFRPTDPATPPGFSCVVGNPPWERVKIQEREFFASRRPEIAAAKNAAARRKLIAQLATSHDPADRRLHSEFRDELRRAEARIHLIRDSGRYPLTGRGDINTYAVFAELARTLVSPRGRVGMVLPTGIATDATTRYFFQDLVETHTLVSLYDFENEENLFPTVHHSYRFCLWTGCGQDARRPIIHVAFRLRAARQIAERRLTLRPADLVLVNPNTRNCPVFHHQRDAEIVIGIYRRIPVLWRQNGPNPWHISFLRMLDMATDSVLFHDRVVLEDDGWELCGNVMLRDPLPGDRGRAGDDRMLPLYEAKMVHHFDHRFGTYDGQTRSQANVGTLPRPTHEHKQDPAHSVLPRYWVSEKVVTDRLRDRPYAGWLLGWRDVCRSSDVRTLVATAIPHSAVGHKFLLAMTAEPCGGLLQANLSSFIVDYCARQKIAGTSLSYSTLKQLPVLPPEEYRQDCPWQPDTTLSDWILARVLELSYTSHDMAAFARHHGVSGQPYRWDEQRRHLLRAELDAAYFHLYGVSRADVSYVLDTFRAFRNKHPELFKSTKDCILAFYDAMARSITTGQEYQTAVEPAPGDGPRHSTRE